MNRSARGNKLGEFLTMDAPLPPEKLPTCWEDDKRMNALFAPCKHFNIAPEAWRQKMTFWSEQLRSWCRHRRSPTVSVTSARNAFMRRGNRPACLDVVLEDCIRNGEYVPVSTYTNALTGSREGWVRWSTKLAFKPAALAVSFLTSYLPFDRTPHDGMAVSSIDHDQVYVNQIVVKELATEYLRGLSEDSERVGTLEELTHHAKQAGYAAETFHMLLGYMMTTGLAVKLGDLYKLAEPGAAKSTPIGEIDMALHRLLSAERKLAADVDRFRQEEEKCVAQAKRALQYSKVEAKTHLRRKHELSKRAATSEAALDNVRRLLLEMRQAELNTDIVNTYRQSVGAMKRVMREERLDEDTAHDTMDELRDVLEQYGEVERSLAGPLDEDADELESELNELLASQPGLGGSPSAAIPAPRAKGRASKPVERDFVFDGEERMLEELDKLSVPESSARAGRDSELPQREKVVMPVQDSVVRDKPVPNPEMRSEPKPSRDWYPKERVCTETIDTGSKSTADNAWDPANNPKTPERPTERVAWKRLDKLENSSTFDTFSNSMSEIRTDSRLHPGQKLTPTKSDKILYNTDFQVQDHRLNDGVWFYNSDDNSNRIRTVSDDFGASMAFEGANANVVAGNFNLTPGGERKKQEKADELDDLERRLRNLRSLN